VKSLPTSLFLMLVLSLAGCGGGIPDADEAASRGILLVGNGAEPRTMDPQRMTAVNEAQVSNALCEGLIGFHLTDDNLPAPGVAASWEHNADASVWTFHLQPEARWSNGDPVTAEDFVYSYRRLLDPAFPGQYAQMLYQLKNGQAYKEGDLSDFAEVGVKAVDEKTLQLELIGPTPYFLNMLKHQSWYPVHPPTIEAFGGPLDLDGEWTLPGNYVSNGTFMLEEWLPDQYLRVVRNPHYWGNAGTRLNEIYFFPVADASMEKMMFESGRLHITNRVPSNSVPVLRETRPEIIHVDPYLSTTYILVNVHRPPLDNPLVREALAWSLDRQTMVDKVLLGGQHPAGSMVPPGFSGYRYPEGVAFDPERARARLAEAGYAEGEGFPELTLLLPSLGSIRKLAEAIVEMWRENLGIDIILENKEPKVWLDVLDQQDYDLSGVGWYGDYMDPITFLEIFRTGNGNNNTGWSNARFDELLHSAFRAPTREQHYRDLEAAEAILVEELPGIPLYNANNLYLMDPRVRNWFPKLLNNHPFQQVYFAEPVTAE